MNTDDTAYAGMADATLLATQPSNAQPPSQLAPLRLDEAALGRLRDLDPSGSSRLVERVCDAFESSMQRMLPTLVAGLPAGTPTQPQLDALRLIVHTLKSSAATVGAVAMSRQCGDIEALLRDGHTAGVAERITGLLAETVRVRQALRMLMGRPA